jgi:hypothetical protein
MRMHRSTFIAINIVVAAVLVGVVAVGIWLVMGVNVDTSPAASEVKLVRLQASAQVYHSRLRYYSGVCDDIGVPRNFRCREAERSYAIEAPVPGGGYLCIDSTGFSGKTKDSIGSETKCKTDG